MTAIRVSMLQSIERGRRTEVDAVQGFLVREAERLGVDAPATVLCHRLSRAASTRRSREPRRRGVSGPLLARAGELYGDRPFLSFAHDERELSFAEAASAGARLAGGLAGLGVGPGDRVLLMLRNRLEFVLGWLGAATLGAVQVPVNVDYRGAFLEHLVTTSGARVILVEDALLDAVEASLPRLPELRPWSSSGRRGRCRAPRRRRSRSSSRASPRAVHAGPGLRGRRDPLHVRYLGRLEGRRSCRTAPCTCSARGTASSWGSARRASTSPSCRSSTSTRR